MLDAVTLDCESHPDHEHHVSTVVWADGSLAAASDVALVVVLLREALEARRS